MMIATKTQREAKGRALLAPGLLLAALMAAWLMLAASPAHTATPFTVNSTGDAGDDNPGDGSCFTGVVLAIGDECTLRAAIEETNAIAPTVDTINFNIDGAGPHTISPASELPEITQPVTINGYSQPRSSPNTATTGTNAVLKVVLNGSNAPVPARGLQVYETTATVKGLVINNFSIGVVIANTFGDVPTRASALKGCFIGTDATGTSARANRQAGAKIHGLHEVVVGGTKPAARNLISGNSGHGLRIDSASSKVRGNLIGTNKDGTSPLGNGSSGVGVTDQVSGFGNTIGGNGTARNTIAFNGGSGVALFGALDGHRILSNSIHDNGGLGIDLSGDGVTPNDPGDPDFGENGLQNYPEITDAITAGLTTTISGGLDSTATTTFTLRFFSNPSGGEEGRTFIGQQSVTTDATGNAPFTFGPDGRVPAGQTITATATGEEGTSDFSAPRTVRTVLEQLGRNTPAVMLPADGSCMTI